MSESRLVVCEFSKWWQGRDRTAVTLLCCLAIFHQFVASDDSQLLQSSTHNTQYQYVNINVSFVDYVGKKELSKAIQGYYGKQSIVAGISGVVVQALTTTTDSRLNTELVNNYGCHKYTNKRLPSEAWIALVERGECSFSQKITVASRDHNASAIVIYNDQENMNSPILMDHDKAPPFIAVLLSKDDGREIAGFMEKGYTVYMHMKPGMISSFNAAMQNSISKTSVLFVSISFVVLMIVSLAWLVFYYIQRFRYSHAKERLARRLTCAAKKAITKIPQRTLKIGDKELDSEYDPCAVCIEPYKFHEVIRILPCRHAFHKSCVDPWLLDQRSCPMCKLDILRAYGMQIGGSQESLHPGADVSHGVTTNPEEPEVNSSLDNQANEATVMLISDTCLHFCGTASEGAETSRKTDDSQGAVGSCSHHTSPSASSVKSHGHTRAGRVDKADSISSEKKALIKKSGGVKIKWTSEDACSSHDESDDKTASLDVAGSTCVAEEVVGHSQALRQ